MGKNIFCLLLCIITSSMLWAQTLTPKAISTSGGSSSVAGGTVSWSIGETNIATLTSGTTVLSQGIQQPEVDILTGSITGTAFCAGVAVSVPFTASGYYGSGNVFTAQLSDGYGNFASPVNIGTLTSTASASITATIPLNTANSNAYRIRIISNHPNYIGKDNGAFIIYPVFTSGSIATAGETVPYDGNPAIISNLTSASGGNGVISYQWQRSTTGSASGFADISGATASTYNQEDTITLTTWYRRQAKDEGCNASWTLSAGVWKVTVVNAPGVIVRNTLNSGYGSLRTAIANVADAGTVTFVNGINGQIITLTTGTLTIDKNIILDNSNHANGIIISGAGDNITINTGKVLTLASNSRITVIGAIRNNAGKTGLVLESGSSFIQNNVDLQATAKRYLDKGWHLFGTPFKKSLLSMANLAPAGGSLQLKPYDNGINWQTIATSSYLIPTIGYAIKPSANYTMTLSGNLYYCPMTSDYTNTLTFNGTSSSQSWNLMANPYTSYINWKLLGKTNVNQSFYLWDNTMNPTLSPTTNTTYFRTYNALSNVGVPVGTTPYIAPLQGFFVKACNTNPKLSFPPSARTHSNSAYYKDASTEIVLRLKAETGEGADELVICKNNTAKQGFEEFDSEKMLNGNPLEMYSYAKTGEKLTINTIDNTQTIIPLGINGMAGSKAKITAFALETSNQVYLEDRHKGKLISLSENTEYSFDFPTNELQGRFFIRFGDVNTPITSSDVKVFKNSNELNVIAQTGENIEQLEVYSLTGACLFKANSNSNMFTTSLDLATGVYMIRVKTNITTQNVKLNWK